jgi:hypothetical protein
MANYSELIETINEHIKTNGAGAITGQILNDVLQGMVSALGENYAFGGIATPATNPGTPTTNVFYLASQAGTYTYFGNIVFRQGVSVLVYNGSGWNGSQLLSFDSADVSSSAKGIFESEAALNAAFPNPKVGWYAYVGNALPLALYKCETTGTWINTGIGVSNLQGVDQFAYYEPETQTLSFPTMTNVTFDPVTTTIYFD